MTAGPSDPATSAAVVGQDAQVMSLRGRETPTLSEDERSALRMLLGRPLFELIPLRDALERADALPEGAVTTVTASPSHGIEATISLCEALIARGHPATPHLAAHMIRDRAHLAELLDRCVSAGIRDVFVVGGDAKDRGEIHDGLALLRMMEELGHGVDAVGFAGYPEGHPSIPEEVLLSSLKEKQRHASYLTTQMSFDADAIASWIARIRSAGVTLPVHLGLAGPVDVRRLLRVAARIGVGGSLRYLRKNRQLLRLLFGGSFTPQRLLRSLGPTIADPEAHVRALHLFTFNQVEATVAWQRRIVGEMRPG
ncbi:MAG TPA: methylenetetrahydrofolate reductase [Actinomycetota bacterium]|nr:methylenetetrahydrofolate reductase [Actinomycetota bacterium]